MASMSFRSSTVQRLTHLRPLTCAAESFTRLAPNPPDLIRWVRHQGGFVHKALKISGLGSHGLSLIASQDISKGSQLIALPNHLPLSFPTSEASDSSDSALIHLGHQVPEELWAMKLGLKLLQERAKVGSYWWPYIGNLPETFSVPIFFPGEDIKNLQYAPLLHQVNKRCRFLLDFEKEIKQVVENLAPENHPFGGKDVDASSLGWAMSAVSSRAFRLHNKALLGDTLADIPMLLPLIDMCNHSFHPNAQIVQEQDSSDPTTLVKVLAETSIEKNTPVTLNYGCLSNDLLLLDYGFVFPSNPYDHVELKYDGVLLDAASMAAGVSSPTFSSPAEWQQQILSQLKLHGDGAFLKVTLGGPDLMDGRLIAALRVLLANDMDTVLKHNLKTLQSLSVEAPLGIRNEIAAFRTVIALCVIALEHFPTNIMEDESLLRQAVSDSTKLALEFRIQKKSLIINIMKELTRKVKILSKNKDMVQGQA